MNSGILPMLLLCATLALSLALAPTRIGWLGLVAMAAGALLMSLLPLPANLSEAIFIGLWLSVVATAVLTYVPRRFADRVMIPAGFNAGAWVGALATVSEMRGSLLPALSLGLLSVPARRFTLHGYHIVIKVIASWMIAIALLSAFVSLMPTPGYKPDHME